MRLPFLRLLTGRKYCIYPPVRAEAYWHPSFGIITHTQALIKQQAKRWLNGNISVFSSKETDLSSGEINEALKISERAYSNVLGQ